MAFKKPQAANDWTKNQQCLGSDFIFEPDQAALQSILDNKGVTRVTLMEQLASRPSSLTPAKHLPDGFRKDKNTEKLEFFEGAGGKVFFRRKVVTPGKDGTKKGKGFGRFKKNRGGDQHVPMRMGSTVKPKLVGRSPRRSPLLPRTTNTPEIPKAASEKKINSFFPTHRQSISERKPVSTRSCLPQPSNNARKSLYFSKTQCEQSNDEPGHEDVKHSDRNESFEFAKPYSKDSKVNFPLEPLTALTRESFRLLPSQSRAWLAQIPRDSVTFGEIEKMMNEEDTRAFEAMERSVKPTKNVLTEVHKNCIRDDNTGSFEELEQKLKTPKAVCTQKQKLISQDKENVAEVQKNSGNDDNTGSFEALEQTLKTPKAVHIQNQKLRRENKENAEVEDQENNEQQFGEADTKSKYQKKYQMFGKSNEMTIGGSKIVEDLSINKTPILVKSCSMIDLELEKDIPLATSASMENLRENEELFNLVSVDKMAQVLDDLAKYREEQDRLEEEKLAIFAKIKERRDQFKTLWGVSPMSVNKIRTVIPERMPSSTRMSNSPEVVPGVTVPEVVPVVNVPCSDQNILVGNCSPITPCATKLQSDATPITVTPPSTRAALTNPLSVRRVRFNSGSNCVAAANSPGSPSPDEEDSPTPQTLANFSNSFSALRSSFSFLQTPKVNQHPKKRIARQFAAPESPPDNIRQDRMSVPTPVALRSLSDRVHAELSRLYAESSDECEDTEETIIKMNNLVLKKT